MASSDTPAEKNLRKTLKGEALKRAPDPAPTKKKLDKILDKAKKGRSK